MKPSFEQALIEVWREVLVENATMVELGAERYAVRLTPKRRLRQVDFVVEDKEMCGLRQGAMATVEAFAARKRKHG
jgi:hypothetical protein